MTQSKKVFIEANVFFAFIDRAHPKHDQADAYFRYFAQEQYALYSDITNVMEAYTRVYVDISPSLAKDVLRTFQLSNINIIYPDESDMKAGIKALINFQSPELTLHKALMAVLAERRGISQICTFEYLHSLFGLTSFYLPI